ncbi:MAG TPA: hypothetical protein VFM91_00045 [Propionibacteriaceae bacterium]|nr:hypothetical protein [Propionibacteriaceae bacterium]
MWSRQAPGGLSGAAALSRHRSLEVGLMAKATTVPRLIRSRDLPVIAVISYGLA